MKIQAACTKTAFASSPPSGCFPPLKHYESTKDNTQDLQSSQIGGLLGQWNVFMKDVMARLELQQTILFIIDECADFHINLFVYKMYENSKNATKPKVMALNYSSTIRLSELIIRIFSNQFSCQSIHWLVDYWFQTRRTTSLLTLNKWFKFKFPQNKQL